MALFSAWETNKHSLQPHNSLVVIVTDVGDEMSLIILLMLFLYCLAC